MSKLAVPAVATALAVPPTKFDPPVADASRVTLPVKFSAMLPSASRAAALTLNGSPARTLATGDTDSWFAVTLNELLLTPVTPPAPILPPAPRAISLTLVLALSRL